MLENELLLQNKEYNSKIMPDRCSERGEERILSKVISGKALIDIISEGRVIENGDVQNCDAIKYDFVLDSKFLKAQYGGPIDYSDLKPIEQKEAIISPGEVVFVRTRETINLPSNMFLQLSPKRGMTEYGILTLGGFAVDPGYSGKLMFGLYNFSSRPFRLLPGKKLAGAVFHQLDDDESTDIDKITPPKAINDFPPRLVDMIKECSPIGLTSLEDAVREIKKQVEVIEKGVTNNQDSIESLKKIVRETRDDIDENNRQIERIGNQIDDLMTGLKQETFLRKESEQEIDKRLFEFLNGLKQEADLRKELESILDKKIEATAKETNEKINFLKGASWIATSLIVAVISFFAAWLAGWLKF